MSLQINQSLRRKELFFLKVHIRTWTTLVMMFVFSSPGPRLTPWRKPQVMRGRNAPVEASARTISGSNSALRQSARMDEIRRECHIQLKCAGSVPCKSCLGNVTLIYESDYFVCVPSALTLWPLCVCMYPQKDLEKIVAESGPDIKANKPHVICLNEVRRRRALRAIRFCRVPPRPRAGEKPERRILFPDREVFAQLVICSRELKLDQRPFESPTRHYTDMLWFQGY